MTARKVVTRSGRGVRGYSPSFKMKKMIPWESTLERDAILILEFSHNVKSYWAQPQKFNFYQGEQQKFCYPDFRMQGSEHDLTHIEVKPSSKLKCPVLQARLNAIKDAHESQGLGYQVWDELYIRKEPRLSNLKLLAYHMPGLNDDLNEQQEAMQRMAILPAKTVGGAVAVLKELRHIYQLLAIGYYNCDLEQPITMESTIFRKEDQ